MSAGGAALASGKGGVLPPFLCLLGRDLRLGWRRPAEGITPVGFCLVTATLFALGAGPDRAALAGIAPGVIWTTALLAMVISVETMFSSDHDDGTLEQLLVSPNLLALMVCAKVAARWMWSALPLVALSPLIGLMLGLAPEILPALALTLVIGTPTLFLVGAFGAALLVGQRKGAALLSLLVLPLCMPVLIFAAGSVKILQDGGEIGGALSLLGALLALAVTLMPLATAAVLAANGSGG